ncbi:MAG: dicarboxylate/amino acid:cation symporter [Rickettsiales bacterium]|jgi:Na+/H+-dicarboxylate symporter|nr:dicarboxylate/amino acid:cation symporter [Rickettsiales bacterium]
MTKIHLWQKIFIAMILGAMLGYLIGDKATMLKPIGDIFVNMIKMIVIPLIFFSISAAITSMEHTHSLGRIGTKSIILYLFSTAIALVIALCLATIFDPSAGVQTTLEFNSNAESSNAAKVSLASMIVNMVPTNPVQAMAEGNVLQIIVFAVFLGTAVNLAGKKVEKVAEAFSIAAEVTYSLTSIIMKFAPYGVFALIGWVVGTQEPEIITSLGMVVVVVIFACIFHMLIVYSLFIGLLSRLNPLIFFKKIADAQIMAFSTSSSSATLPITMKVAEEKLGVSKGTAKFVLPLGSTINMDGTAIYLGICSIFVAGLVGVDLVFMDFVTIIFTATIASIGAAGIPGVALIMMSMVFTAIGLPIEAIALIAGVDRILDMVRTTVNVTGDLAVSVVIDQSEGTLNERLFNDLNVDLEWEENK